MQELAQEAAWLGLRQQAIKKAAPAAAALFGTAESSTMNFFVLGGLILAALASAWFMVQKNKKTQITVDADVEGSATPYTLLKQ